MIKDRLFCYTTGEVLTPVCHEDELVEMCQRKNPSDLIREYSHPAPRADPRSELFFPTRLFVTIIIVSPAGGKSGLRIPRCEVIREGVKMYFKRIY